MNMREKIARALEASALSLGLTEDESARELWTDLAVSVLDAMRKPTNEMLLAGQAEACDYHTADAVWEAMIAAANEE